ncbi:MAG TPA: FHA domain-containing protein [Pirellulaceae bacterium]|nr:FHA domain-containing protein [Pirellulaceae bacterium]
MFPPWRFKLKEAQVALEQGRLEEAARAVEEPDLRQFLPVQQTLAEVADQMARRALERAAAGDIAAGWRDLEEAKKLGGESADWLRHRQAVAEVSVGEIVNHLKAGDFTGAVARIDSLDKRKIPGLPLQALLEVTRRLDSARKLAARSKFAEADEQLAAASALQPDLPLIDEQRQLYRERADRSRSLTEQLHAALAANDWTKVLAIATELLEIAPEHRVARDARKRAWAAVGERIGDSRRMGETHHWTGTPNSNAMASVASPESPEKRAPRFMLWIDAVGGYLVCLGDEVTIGQAVPNNRVDVPILADLSRKHAKICRRGEGYVLEPLGHKLVLDGKPVTGPTLLSDGDEFVLSEAVKLRFRKPHALSASARLEMLSPHRTQPGADAVILMAESCVLGPKWQNHVVCRDWNGDVVLYRSDHNIMCRAMESIEIDGRLHDGRGPVRPGSHVLGTDFSLSLEAV